MIELIKLEQKGRWVASIFYDSHNLITGRKT